MTGRSRPAGTNAIAAGGGPTRMASARGLGEIGEARGVERGGQRLGKAPFCDADTVPWRSRPPRHRLAHDRDRKGTAKTAEGDGQGTGRENRNVRDEDWNDRSENSLRRCGRPVGRELTAREGLHFPPPLEPRQSLQLEVPRDLSPEVLLPAPQPKIGAAERLPFFRTDRGSPPNCSRPCCATAPRSWGSRARGRPAAPPAS